MIKVSVVGIDAQTGATIFGLKIFKKDSVKEGVRFIDCMGSDGRINFTHFDTLVDSILPEMGRHVPLPEEARNARLVRTSLKTTKVFAGGGEEEAKRRSGDTTHGALEVRRRSWHAENMHTEAVAVGEESPKLASSTGLPGEDNKVSAEAEKEQVAALGQAVHL